MSRLKLITDLSKSGELTNLYRSGLIGYKVLMYRDIYFDLGCEQMKGLGKMQCAQNIADKYGISIDTVWRAVRYITYEDSSNNTASGQKTLKVLK
jgi:hypothetical protein